MSYYKIVPALLVSICPLLAAAEDAQSILGTMQEKRIERTEGVDAYVVLQSVMGQKLRLSYERIELEAADGTTYPTFAPVRGNATNASSSALMGSYADGLENAGLSRRLFKDMGGASGQDDVARATQGDAGRAAADRGQPEERCSPSPHSERGPAGGSGPWGRVREGSASNRKSTIRG